jgi:hypothetical protein
MTYLDVGTNLDARGAYSDGRLLMQLNLERSWVEGDVSVPVAKSEGQPVESTMATDPISAKVLKVDVSFTIVK